MRGASGSRSSFQITSANTQSGCCAGTLLRGRLTRRSSRQRVGEAWRARYAQELWQALRFLPVDRTPRDPHSESSGTAAAALVVGLAWRSCLMVFTLGARCSRSRCRCRRSAPGRWQTAASARQLGTLARSAARGVGRELARCSASSLERVGATADAGRLRRVCGLDLELVTQIERLVDVLERGLREEVRVHALEGSQ